jgi:hypothetical protein
MKAKRLERKMGEAHEPTSKSVAEEEEAGAGYGTTVIKKGGEEEEAEDPSENGFGTTRIHTEAEDNNNEYGTTVIKTTEDEEEGTLENGYGTTRIHNEAEDNGYGTTVINGLQSQPQASDGTRIVATNSSDKVSEQSQQPETMDITEEEDDVDSSITHIDQVMSLFVIEVNQHNKRFLPHFYVVYSNFEGSTSLKSNTNAQLFLSAHFYFRIYVV